MARLIEQTMTMDASTEHAFRHASAVAVGFADQVKLSLEVRDQIIHQLNKVRHPNGVRKMRVHHESNVLGCSTI